MVNANDTHENLTGKFLGLNQMILDKGFMAQLVRRISAVGQRSTNNAQADGDMVPRVTT